MEGDLDGEVPDAEDAEGEDGEEWEDEVVEGEVEVEMGDEEEGEERDLDGEVPEAEAGSYVLTDSEAEADGEVAGEEAGSSDGEDWIGPSMRMAGRVPAGGGGRQGLLAGQVQGSVGAVGSSVEGSSPVGLLGGRRSGGFAGRMRGREN